MTRDRNGGDRDGMGLYELLKLALWHPIYYTMVTLMLKFHMTWLAKRMLGIH